MTNRNLPVRPNLNQLKQQAKKLLRDIHKGEPSALAELQKYHVKQIAPANAKLADAQLVLARSYGLPSWLRLALACRMTDAIWRDDVKAVQDLILKYPKLLHENARGVRSHWGPPMSYAANLGRDAIISMLHNLGAADLQLAFDRACLQGRIDTAKQLYQLGARPTPGALMGPAETQNDAGMALLLELGAQIGDAQGDRWAPVALVLQTYCRNPKGKHQCLELLARHGINLPDTAPIAIHRGRIDLLAKHLDRNPHLLNGTFSHNDIYPLELGCNVDRTLALHGTPLDGTTLLHLCVDNDELEIAQWLIKEGADVNARAAIDSDGFGGHTPLFGCVVSQTYCVGLRKDDAFARLLLDHGAAINIHASLKKQLRFVDDESLHEYRDVTPLSWGEQFHNQQWVNRSVMQLLIKNGGQR